jgi:glycosyltransferase involved in cell wall biosynthesis
MHCRITRCQTERVPVSVVIPTIGRETLRATLTSVASQLESGDEVLVVADGRPARAREIFARQRRRRWRYLETDGPCNDAGGTQRDLAATVARGDHLCFMDDDDVFTPDALAAIRRGVAQHPERVLLFRMDNYGTVLWRDREIRYGNVGTPMVVVPNDSARLASWRLGDYEFIRDSCHRLGEPVWCDEVVAVVRPHVPR